MNPYKRLILLLALLAGFSFLVSFGILGVGRAGKIGNFDGAVLYAAGCTWLAGGNAYDHALMCRSVEGKGVIDLSDADFAYPPQSAAICVTLAHFPYSTANELWLGLNLLSLFLIIGLTAYSLLQRHDKIGPWVMAAVILGNPFTTHVIWMGQTSLIVLTALLASFTFYSIGEKSSRRIGWQLAAGICLGLASFKPQLCLLPGLWLLLERRWIIIIISAVTAVCMSYYPLMLQGPVGMIQSWHDAIVRYSSSVFNVVGSPHKVGLDTLCQAAGWNVPGFPFTLLGIAGTVFLWTQKRRFHNEDVFALLMLLTFGFIGFNHDYDFVALIPALTSLWFYASRRRVYWGVVLPLVLLFFCPQRLVHRLGLPIFDHWRTVIVLLMLWAIVDFSIRSRSDSLREEG